MLTDGYEPSDASTFLTIVSRGCRFARPPVNACSTQLTRQVIDSHTRLIPGGKDEQPVANCRNSFLSSPVMSTRTSTKRRKPGLGAERSAGESDPGSAYLSRVKPNFGSVKAIRSSRVQDGTWSPHNISSSSSGEKHASLESGNTELNPSEKERGSVRKMALHAEPHL